MTVRLIVVGATDGFAPQVPEPTNEFVIVRIEPGGQVVQSFGVPKRHVLHEPSQAEQV